MLAAETKLVLMGRPLYIKEPWAPELSGHGAAMPRSDRAVNPIAAQFDARPPAIRPT